MEKKLSGIDTTDIESGSHVFIDLTAEKAYGNNPFPSETCSC